MESLSKFVSHSLIPAIHPTAEDMAMGAVDFTAEHPLENSTIWPSSISTILPTSAPLNATVGQRILDAVRVVVPTVVDFVVPTATPVPPVYAGIPTDVPAVHGSEPILPVDVHVDLYPQVVSKVFLCKQKKNSN
jgi:hypothetical protein